VADDADDASDEVSTRLTPQQGVLLLRFAAARLVLARLENLFLLKYLLLAGAVAVIVLDVSPSLGILLIALFVLAAAAQWIVTRLVRRLGAVHRLADLDSFVEGAATSWWPNLRGELKRVGLKSRPWSVLRLGSRFATRRLPDDQQQALRRIEWRAVLPLRELRQARRSLARAAGTRGAPRGTDAAAPPAE
jgi:hypothetical protein